jgi:hypothetical protein
MPRRGDVVGPPTQTRPTILTTTTTTTTTMTTMMTTTKTTSSRTARGRARCTVTA